MRHIQITINNNQKLGDTWSVYNILTANSDVKFKRALDTKCKINKLA